MPTSPSIIVLGSSNTDLVIRSARLPRPGETVLGGRFYQAAGGKGANQAVAAARLATLPVLFVAALGDDALGDAAFAGLSAEGLELRYLKRVPGEPSGVALILVDEQGENLIAVASGANLQLTPEDVDRVDDAFFDGAKVFLASLESPLAAVRRGLERARAHRLMTILNPAPADALVGHLELLPLVDVLTPNEHELAMLAGRPEGDYLAAAAELRHAGCGAVIVTRGELGCLIVDEGTTPIPAQPVTPVDATGAGDAFNGALAVALSEGRSLLEAARFATRAAGIAVTREGAQPSMPRRAELPSWLSG